MDRHYDDEAMRRDVAGALETVFARHGIDSLYATLAVTTVLEVMASPLKLHQDKEPLSREMGLAGTRAYLASRLVHEVELLKSPHSRIVNPMMSAIAAALARHKGPVPDDYLLRNSLRILLDRPRLGARAVRLALQEDASLTPAFQLARSYLEQGGVIVRTQDGKGWGLTGSLGL